MNINTDNRNRKERSGWRKHNSNKKRLLESLGFPNTKTCYLKDWLSERVHCSKLIDGDDFPVKVCYGIYVGAFKTWADACYNVALLELKKGKRI